jgi:hypothetical protein
MLIIEEQGLGTEGLGTIPLVAGSAKVATERLLFTVP